ncbi:response regulator [Caenispirillum salinarum]|uniref:response regulator n=1 Tax=Caenispirillum salinarum TaxID=859058 RepID=UPI00384CC125
MNAQPLFLLVEDNRDDAELTREALKEADPRVTLEWARDGEECLEYLRSDKPEPDLILLDLNMPRMDGREALREIKGNEAWRHIPVVILTTSEAEADVMESYRHFANAYMVKPITIDDLIDIMTQLSTFWLNSFVRRPAAI